MRAATMPGREIKFRGYARSYFRRGLRPLTAAAANRVARLRPDTALFDRVTVLRDRMDEFFESGGTTRRALQCAAERYDR